MERNESDSMGSIAVPEQALWGASTERARVNFAKSGRLIPLEAIHALGFVKAACARVNLDLEKLDAMRAELILKAGREVAAGEHDSHFVLDVFQTGSGTSTNMNANEVIANRANEIAGFSRGAKDPVHPNDHVNMGQSSNDVFPTALHVAVCVFSKSELLPVLCRLQAMLEGKARLWDDVVKPGRTHLMDATPVRMGQVFGGFAGQIAQGIERLEAALEGLKFLAIGGTAVGTGINTHPEFGKRVAAELSKSTGIRFLEAVDHFEAQGSKNALLHFSGALRTAAASLSKIANDIRLMASGPNCGLGELVLPEIQPGSSIMPGKVNPVISEAVIQMSVRIVANDMAASFCDFGGVGSILELNVAMPLMGDSVIESARLLAESSRLLCEKLLPGLEADGGRCEKLAGLSLMAGTRLASVIGYDRAASLVKRASREGISIREAASGLMEAQKLEEMLDLVSMTMPGEQR
ncbi:MAG: class II fumarate hydratase [Burkholderiales bacterium]|nr:class II fumarate hydratase [Burkholderiales bacterium]